MKKIAFIFTFLFLIVSLCSADTLYLKSGRIVKGDILEKTEDQIKINANGLTLTYYADEVDRIEGSSQASQPAAIEPPLPSLSLPQETSTSAPSRSAEYMLMTKRELTLKYMEATGAKGNMRKTFSEIINAASEEKREELKKVLNLDDVLEQLVPVYDQYFTEQDLRELIMFYESPLGQKVLKTAPLILKDSMDTSIKYFQGKLE
jgi:hypothetical protein